MQAVNKVDSPPDVDKTEMRMQALRRLKKNVDEKGWNPRLAKRFDNLYCYGFSCGICPMERDCPRPGVEGFDTDFV